MVFVYVFESSSYHVGVIGSDENGRKQAEKLLSHFRFYIFSGNGIGFGEKTELKTDGDIRKYGNRQIQTESQKNKLE